MAPSQKIIPYSASSFKFQKERFKKKLIQIGIDISDTDATKITFLSRRKYDRYELLPPGETFYIRLLQWLTLNFKRYERETAFSIVKALKFIDDYELKELSICSFENIKKQILLEIGEITASNWYSYINIRNNILESELSKTIFVACADDIKFDFFRRHAMYAHPKPFKKDNFIEYYKINKSSLKELPEYNRIILVDQLSGSGTTTIRKEIDEKTNDEFWTGKIPRFFKIWNGFIKNKKIYYSPYIISYVSKKNISERIPQWIEDEVIENDVKCISTCNIPISPCISNKTNTDIDETIPVAKLCKKYYKYFKEDEHTKKVGGIPYGYGRAGLTLILQSNCPNSTPPILWHSYENWYPLFPRVIHHR